MQKGLLMTFSLITLLVLTTSCEQKVSYQPNNGWNYLIKLQEHYGIKPYYNSNVSYNINGDLDYTVKRYKNLSYYTMQRTANNITYLSTYKNGHIEYYINDTLQDSGSYSRIFMDSKLDAFVFNSGIPSTLNGNNLLVDSLTSTLIRNKNYITLHIHTKPIEGLEDFSEYYLYVNDQTKNIEYMAINDKLTNPVNLVFRRMYNHRNINGILFSDYYSFVPLDDSIVAINELYKNFNKVNLKELENIEYQNIEVTLLD